MKTNQKFRFRTILQQSGKTATGIEIPPEIIDKLGSGKKPAIKVTINGFTYRSTVAVMSGAFMVGVNAENRIGANIKGSDKIDVTIELDTEERVVEVPVDFQRLLDRNADAKKIFATLSHSRKKQIMAPINNAKTEETRRRRIKNGFTMLLNK